MSIASEITRINTNIANAYTACDTMGATMPASGSQNSANLATTISSIPSGGGIGIPREVSQSGVFQMPTSSFTFELPSNATDLGEYSLAYDFYNCIGLTSIDFSGLTTISNICALYYTFKNCSGLISIDLSSLTTITGTDALSYAFQNCTGLTGVSFDSLTTINSDRALYYAFAECSNITNVNLSNLTSINGLNALSNAFNGCTSLTSVDLSSLTTVTGTNAMRSAFVNCANLVNTVSTTDILLPSLETIGENSSTANNAQFAMTFNGTIIRRLTFPELKEIYCTGSSNTTGTFYNNYYLQKLCFPKLDTITYGAGASSSNQTAANNIFYACNELTELHFGAANENAIKATAGWSTLWGRGAGNVTVYFDL